MTYNEKILYDALRKIVEIKEYELKIYPIKPQNIAVNALRKFELIKGNDNENPA